MNHFFEFPFEMYSDIMIKFHTEVMSAKRKDLTEYSRLTTAYCLN